MSHNLNESCLTKLLLHLPLSRAPCVYISLLLTLLLTLYVSGCICQVVPRELHQMAVCRTSTYRAPAACFPGYCFCQFSLCVYLCVHAPACVTIQSNLKFFKDNANRINQSLLSACLCVLAHVCTARRNEIYIHTKFDMHSHE